MPPFLAFFFVCFPMFFLFGRFSAAAFGELSEASHSFILLCDSLSDSSDSVVPERSCDKSSDSAYPHWIIPGIVTTARVEQVIVQACLRRPPSLIIVGFFFVFTLFGRFWAPNFIDFLLNSVPCLSSPCTFHVIYSSFPFVDKNTGLSFPSILSRSWYYFDYLTHV